MKLKKSVLVFVLLLFFSLILFSVPFAFAINIDSKIDLELLQKISAFEAKSVGIRAILPEKVPTEKVLFVVDKGQLNGVASKIGLSGSVKSKFKHGSVIVAEIPLNKIKQLAENTEVESVWLNKPVKVFLDSAVNQVNAPLAWSAGFTGKGVKVAIVDSGIDSSHEMLNGKVVASANFSDSLTEIDLLGHGTHVAGIIAGNGSLKGIAPDALLLNVKVLDDRGTGSTESVVAGINWAIEQNAKVINLSLGGAYNDLGSPINAAIAAAVSNGIVVATAVGNCGNGCPSIDCGGYVGVTTPGNSPNAISVGAVNRNNSIACYSSGGKIDLVQDSIPANGSWFNSSYKNSEKIKITGDHNAINDSIVATLVFDTQSEIDAGRMQLDCDDLIVVYKNKTELPREIFYCNTPNTAIRFRYPTGYSLNANIDDANSFALYFNNPNASTSSINFSQIYGTKHFDNFDGENGVSCNKAIWESYFPNGSVSIQENQCRLAGNGTNVRNNVAPDLVNVGETFQHEMDFIAGSGIEPQLQVLDAGGGWEFAEAKALSDNAGFWANGLKQSSTNPVGKRIRWKLSRQSDNSWLVSGYSNILTKEFNDVIVPSNASKIETWNYVANSNPLGELYFDNWRSWKSLWNEPVFVFGELRSFQENQSIDSNPSTFVIKPDVVAPGESINSSASNNTFSLKTGTSMATGFVSGMIAVLLEQKPELNPLQLKQLIEQTSIDFGETGKDSSFGSGLIDLNSAILNSKPLLSIDQNFSESNGFFSIEVPESIELGKTVSISAKNVNVQILSKQLSAKYWLSNQYAGSAKPSVCNNGASGVYVSGVTGKGNLRVNGYVQAGSYAQICLCGSCGCSSNCQSLGNGSFTRTFPNVGFSNNYVLYAPWSTDTSNSWSWSSSFDINTPYPYYVQRFNGNVEQSNKSDFKLTETAVDTNTVFFFKPYLKKLSFTYNGSFGDLSKKSVFSLKAGNSLIMQNFNGIGDFLDGQNYSIQLGENNTVKVFENNVLKKTILVDSNDFSLNLWIERVSADNPFGVNVNNIVAEFGFNNTAAFLAQGMVSASNNSFTFSFPQKQNFSGSDANIAFLKKLNVLQFSIPSNGFNGIFGACNGSGDYLIEFWLGSIMASSFSGKCGSQDNGELKSGHSYLFDFVDENVLKIYEDGFWLKTIQVNGQALFVKQWSGNYSGGGEVVFNDFMTIEQDLNESNEIDATMQFVVRNSSGDVVDAGFDGPKFLKPSVVGENFSYDWNPANAGKYSVEATLLSGDVPQAEVSGQDIGVYSLLKTVEVKNPSVLSIDSFDFENFEIEKGKSSQFYAIVSNSGNFDLNAWIELFAESENQDFFLGTSGEKTIAANLNELFELNVPVNVPVGDYNIIAVARYADINSFVAKPLKVFANQRVSIESINVPQNETTDQTSTNLSVLLKNSSSNNIAVLPKFQLLSIDGNVLVEQVLDLNEIVANSTATASSTIEIKLNAGNYLAKAIVSNEAGEISSQQNFTVSDVKAPEILEVNYSPQNFIPSIEAISATISDDSKILSAESIIEGNGKIYSMNLIEKDESIIASVALNDLGAGNYSFSIKACDEFNNCNETQKYNFIVNEMLSTCVGKNILIVEDNDGFSTTLFENLGWLKELLENNNYCATLWNKTLHGNISIDYLNDFDAVVWSSGNNVGNALNENDAILLENYIAIPKKALLLNGSEISFEHGFDSIATSLLHSTFESDLIAGNDLYIKTINHPITEGIERIDLNAELSPYPDSIEPIDSTSVAEWNNAKSAVVAFDSGNVPIIFFAFPLSAIIPSETRSKLVLNSIFWILTVKDVAIACHSNADCGENGYIDEAFCGNQNVVKIYRTYECNNAGLPNATCSYADENRTVENCSYGCENANCKANSSPPVLNFMGDKNVVENQLLSFNIAAIDPNDESLTYSVTNLPEGAIFSNQIFSWTPKHEQVGSYQITFTVTNNSAISDSETINLTVEPKSNAVPTVSISATPTEGYAPLTVQFNAIASDSDGSISSYQWSFENNSSSSEPNPSHTFNTVGTYIVSLIVTDNDGATATASTTIIVSQKPNTAPTLNQLPNQSTNEDTALSNNFIDLWQYANDVEDSDSNLILSIISQSNSSLINCSIVSNRFVNCGTPSSNAFGSSDVTVQVKDSGNLTASNFFTITVVPINDAPSISRVPNVSFNEDSSTALDVSPYLSDVDNDKSSLTLSVSGNSHISAIVSNQSINFSANSNWNGSETITISVKDSSNASTSQNISVSVNIINNAPELNNIPDQTLTEGAEFNYTVTATDIDSRSLTFSDNTSLFDINPTTGVISFTPSNSQIGVHDVTMTVSGDGALTDFQVVKFTINAKPRNVPSISGLPDQSTNEDTALLSNFLDLWQYASDVEDVDSSLSFSIIFQSNSSLIDCSIVSNRFVDCSAPTVNVSGTSDVTIQVKNSNNLIAFDSFTITVNAVNDVPLVELFNPIDNPTINEGENQTFIITKLDVDSQNLLTKWYSNDRLVLESNDSYTFNADYNSAGTYSIKAIVSDKELEALHEWRLTINNVSIACYYTSDCGIDDYSSESFCVGNNVFKKFKTNACNNAGLPTASCSSNESDKLIESCQYGCENGVCKSNNSPIINSFTPSTNPTINENQSIVFTINAIDADNDVLTYTWLFDGQQIGANTNSYNYTALIGSKGIRTLTVDVSDGKTSVQQNWTITVNEVVYEFDYTITGSGVESWSEIHNESVEQQGNGIKEFTMEADDSVSFYGYVNKTWQYGGSVQAKKGETIKIQLIGNTGVVYKNNKLIATKTVKKMTAIKAEYSWSETKTQTISESTTMHSAITYADGTKNLGTLLALQAQHDGTIANANYTIIDNSDEVNAWIEGSNAYASVIAGARAMESNAIIAQTENTLDGIILDSISNKSLNSTTQSSALPPSETNRNSAKDSVESTINNNQENNARADSNSSISSDQIQNSTQQFLPLWPDFE